MEERQGIENPVAGRDIGARPQLGHVAHEVAMGQDHALGCALGARSKEDHGRIVERQTDNQSGQCLDCTFMLLVSPP